MKCRLCLREKRLEFCPAQGLEVGGGLNGDNVLHAEAGDQGPVDFHHERDFSPDRVGGSNG